MPFPRNLLNDGEDLVVDLHPHWWFFAGPVTTLVLAVVALIALFAIDAHEVFKIAAAGVSVAAALWVVGRYLRWVNTNFAVTSDRVIYRTGIIGKKGIEIPLERVNTVFFNQGIFERLLGAGDLRIESGGERGSESFTDIKNPSGVQNEIHRQIELNQGRMAQGNPHLTQSAGPTLSVPEQLEKLDDLRQRGVISQAEFDAKKAQLLDRM